MTRTPIDPATTTKALRLWPGLVIVALVLVIRFVVPNLTPDASLVGLLSTLAGTLLILLWWLFFSRAPWVERVGVPALAALAVVATRPLLHISVARGNMGFQFVLLMIPSLALALVVATAATHRRPVLVRRVAIAVALFLGCGIWTLARSKGLRGDGMPELTWRWSQTAEERLLAETAMGPPPAPESAVGPEALPVPPPAATSAPPAGPATGAAAPAADDPAVANDSVEQLPALSDPREVATDPPSGDAPRPAWPGLRGPGRDGVVPGLRIGTDWSQTPPAELWRRPIGPGVSSFAVLGDLLYTQEQRGEDEIVAAHRVATGEVAWWHRDAARFWDAHVGAGPRATPAVGDGRVYTLGGTGILNALDAGDGSVVWSRDVASDTGGKDTMWGFVSSPLVLGDQLLVQAGMLVSYDLATGEPRWFGSEHGGYGSPQALTLDGVPQILLVGHSSTISVSPTDGALLWEHPWAGIGMTQPVHVAPGDLLVTMADAGAAPIGTRRISITHGAAGWSAEERWTSNRLKPSFSDLVVHRGHAYGIDRGSLACIELERGERRWKGGRYGEGQVLLLPDQDLLLVLSERGELALVEGRPETFVERARMPAIEGRTWNQPALAGDVLVVRNGQEMAAFRLPPGS